MKYEKLVKDLSERLDVSTPKLAAYDEYWNGTQPTAFLAPEAAESLGNRLRSVCVNFPRLAVEAVSERLQVTGFQVGGKHSDEAGKIWRRNHMADGSAQAHIDALVYGRSFALVWAGARGATITIESPRNVAVVRDPLTREVTAGFKRWTVDGVGNAFVYLPDEIVRLRSNANVNAGQFPLTGWEVVETIPNPMGVVPLVPIVNRGRLSEVDGISEMADLLDLSDALNKVTADALVTSEFFARPRRWATGLEVEEDEDGNPIKPFSDEAGKLWLSESPDTKFGQFDAARLDGYSDLIATFTQQIGALSGLPPHYLGLNGDQPPSADSIRSAEASLVSRCYALHRVFGRSWADVMALALAAESGLPVDSYDTETLWREPETRTPGQAADAAVKLATVGVPLETILSDTLGYAPEKVAAMMGQINRDRITQQGLDMSKLLQGAAPEPGVARDAA